MKTLSRLPYLLTVMFITFSCNNAQQEATEPKSELIEVTEQQFATDSMQLGKIEIRTFENITHCNGLIVPKPNGVAKLSAPLNGIIKNIHCHPGEKVDKNQILFEVSGNEIIDLQKEFAETAANFKRLKQEFERIRALYIEKAISEKDFFLAEAEYKAFRAKYTGLNLKLETIGINPVQVEDGTFQSSYSITSPIKGYVSSINVSIGMYIETNNELAQIINPEMLQLKLNVFPDDISKMNVGQIVRFRLPTHQTINLGSLISIGVNVEEETKTILCYANISDIKTTKLLANTFVVSEIITNVDTAWVVPNDAVIKTNNQFYILTLHEKNNRAYSFKKRAVSVGRTFKNYTEIHDDLSNETILVKGTYSLVTD